MSNKVWTPSYIHTMSLHILDPNDDVSEIGYLTDGPDDYDASFDIARFRDVHTVYSDDNSVSGDDIFVGNFQHVTLHEAYQSDDDIQPTTEIVPPELHLVQSLQKFVDTTDKSQCIMGMVNYLYRNETLPYDGVELIPCTRLELESEMRCESSDMYDMFIANMSDLKMNWLVHNHSTRNRSFSEANITSLIYENYVGKYVCVSESRSTSVWYFNDTIWIEISPAEMWQEVCTVIDFVRSFSTSTIGREAGWKATCDDIAQYMSSVVARDHIQKDLLYRLTDNKFQHKLNSKSHLIGVANGVYDFGKNMLRDALPMDYVSMSTRVKYLDENDSVLYKELKTILRTIFPNKKVRHFFIQSCASLLEGRNKDKYVYVWWGKGNNGKSMMRNYCRPH